LHAANAAKTLNNFGSFLGALAAALMRLMLFVVVRGVGGVAVDALFAWKKPKPP